MIIPNGRFTVLRSTGERTDEWGYGTEDPADRSAVVTNLPGSISEQRASTIRGGSAPSEAGGVHGRIRRFWIDFAPNTWADFRAHDRIVDQATLAVYLVEHIDTSRGLLAGKTRLDCKHVS